MKPGDTEDLDAALVTFLVGIGAVERVPDEPVQAAKAADESDLKQAPEKSGKAKEK